MQALGLQGLGLRDAFTGSGIRSSGELNGQIIKAHFFSRALKQESSHSGSFVASANHVWICVVLRFLPAFEGRTPVTSIQGRMVGLSWMMPIILYPLVVAVTSHARSHMGHSVKLLVSPLIAAILPC